MGGASGYSPQLFPALPGSQVAAVHAAFPGPPALPNFCLGQRRARQMDSWDEVGSSAFASVCSALWQWLHLVGQSSSMSLIFAHPALTIANRGVPCQLLFASSAFLQHPVPATNSQHGFFSLSEFLTHFGPFLLPRQIVLLTLWSPKGSNDCTLVTKTSFPWA